MKISTRGRYGLKAMVDIAANSGSDVCVPLKSIAERNGISENYLEQLISTLKKSGLVKSTRGAQGGYVLGRPADEITVGDILRSVEGSLELVECVSGDSCGGGDCSCCTTKSVWVKLSESVNEAADNITLAELV